MQLSTTAIAIWIRPSSRTNARTLRGSSTLFAMVSVRLPAVRIGKLVGVISTMAAPARNTGVAQWQWKEMRNSVERIDSRTLAKSEIRSPNSERSPKSEPHWCRADPSDRASKFGFPSDFGIRISDFILDPPIASIDCGDDLLAAFA